MLEDVYKIKFVLNDGRSNVMNAKPLPTPLDTKLDYTYLFVPG